MYLCTHIHLRCHIFDWLNYCYVWCGTLWLVNWQISAIKERTINKVFTLLLLKFLLVIIKSRYKIPFIYLQPANMPKVNHLECLEKSNFQTKIYCDVCTLTIHLSHSITPLNQCKGNYFSCIQHLACTKPRCWALYLSLDSANMLPSKCR